MGLLCCRCAVLATAGRQPSICAPKSQVQWCPIYVDLRPRLAQSKTHQRATIHSTTPSKPAVASTHSMRRDGAFPTRRHHMMGVSAGQGYDGPAPGSGSPQHSSGTENDPHNRRN